MNVILLAFGDKIQYHTQTNFCILSVLQQCTESDIISIYTDRPKFYSRLKERIEVVALDKSTLDKWVNGTGYIYRVKIKAIEDSARRHPDEHLLFLDCDTVCVHSLEKIKQLMDEGNGVMCFDEGHPSKMKGPSRRMWNALANHTINTCTISLKHNVWNSGVIGIPQSKLTEVISLAVNVCDYILQANVRCFTAEQYAFSVAMQEYCKVFDSTKWICHYWGNKEGWTNFIHQFFLKSYMQGDSMLQDIHECAAKNLCNELPNHIKVSNTKRRFKNLLDWMFLDKPTFW